MLNVSTTQREIYQVVIENRYSGDSRKVAIFVRKQLTVEVQ